MVKEKLKPHQLFSQDIGPPHYQYFLDSHKT